MIKLLSVADIISLSNVVLGSFSILLLLLGLPNYALVALFLALIADGMDGVVARRTKKSQLGMYFEAMADMISLAVVPIAFVFFHYLPVFDSQSWAFLSFFIVAIIYLVCSCIRLASFHLLTADSYFLGLPVSAGMLYLLLFSILNVSFLILAVVGVCVSLGMISRVRFPKPGLIVNSLAAVLLILVLLFGTRYSGFAPVVLLIALTGYVFGGPFYYKLQKKQYKPYDRL